MDWNHSPVDSLKLKPINVGQLDIGTSVRCWRPSIRFERRLKGSERAWSSPDVPEKKRERERETGVRAAFEIDHRWNQRRQLWCSHRTHEMRGDCLGYAVQKHQVCCLNASSLDFIATSSLALLSSPGGTCSPALNQNLSGMWWINKSRPHSVLSQLLNLSRKTGRAFLICLHWFWQPLSDSTDSLC